MASVAEPLTLARGILFFSVIYYNFLYFIKCPIMSIFNFFFYSSDVARAAELLEKLQKSKQLTIMHFLLSLMLQLFV